MSNILILEYLARDRRSEAHSRAHRYRLARAARAEQRARRAVERAQWAEQRAHKAAQLAEQARAEVADERVLLHR